MDLDGEPRFPKPLLWGGQMEACGPTAPPTADPKPPLAQSNQPIYKNHASRWCTLIRPKVVHFEVIGDSGSLVADDYAAYNLIEAAHRQSCLSHLIRKAKEVAALITLLPQDQQSPADLRFCEQIRTLLREGCQVAQQRQIGKISFRQARAKIPEFDARLRRICKKACHHPEAENLRQRLLDPKRDYHRLFTFLEINHLAPTNNYAEQTLRHPVIFRKLIFGNRSTFGAQCLAINLSVLHTAKCRQRDPIHLLKTLLLSGAGPAAEILFANSS